MLDNIKLRLLNDKLNILMEKELNLLKSGNESEAEKVSKEIDEVTNKIQSIAQKELERSGMKADKLSAKIDKRIAAFNYFPEVSDKEVEEELDRIIRGK